MERLHTRLLDPAALTLSAFEEACRCLGCDPDAVREGRAEMPSAAPPLSRAQHFLDLTHPRHGITLAEMRQADAEALMAVAAANFTVSAALRSARQPRG